MTQPDLGRVARPVSHDRRGLLPRQFWGLAPMSQPLQSVEDEYMLTTALPTFLDWLIDNAVLLLFGSVIITVLGELMMRHCRGRSIDLRGSMTSISAGLAYISAKGIVSKVVSFAVAMYIYNNHRLFDVSPANPLVWVGIFLCRDFVYYWIHRTEHRVKVLWASHMIHHSSEEFTFTTAVRMPWMEALYKPALGFWAPLLGFHPLAFAAMGALVLIAGQFQHTELMRRRTVLDLVFVTPSAHRVHHGSNAEYLDKNFGSMLIVWDRLFGTFAAETAPVTYGLTGGKRVRTPADALVGGYRDLSFGLRGLGMQGSIRHLVSRP